ncbi:hypothetical protein BRADI_5g09285v3 [Brachypodium distachyon]|uniref:Uncharacterized protein n=1 Tax=Brachypodium distachyon TaxID=15368 RepID=A0A2K2CG69_BRADI|nr:hypothetical protein BRADI_5g09285v3 [Brachypodium distachyon]
MWLTIVIHDNNDGRRPASCSLAPSRRHHLRTRRRIAAVQLPRRRGAHPGPAGPLRASPRPALPRHLSPPTAHANPPAAALRSEPRQAGARACGVPCRPPGTAPSLPTTSSSPTTDMGHESLFNEEKKVDLRHSTFEEKHQIPSEVTCQSQGQRYSRRKRKSQGQSLGLFYF